MNTFRITAILVGVLYIIGTVAGILSMVVTGTVLDTPNSAAEISANANQIVLGALFVLTMGLALAMVPVLMYPILKKYNSVLAMGYVVFRGALETVTYLVLAISWLAVVNIGQEYVRAGATAAAGFQESSSLVLALGATSFTLTEIIFPLGALMFYIVLYQSKLIPRWISGWGLIAVVPYLATGFSHVFGLTDSTSTISTLMFVPMLLQEMVMAVWFIVKGFNSAAMVVGSDSTDMPRNKLAHSAA
jgi:hypothetical protein